MAVIAALQKLNCIGSALQTSLDWSVFIQDRRRASFPQGCRLFPDFVVNTDPDPAPALDIPIPRTHLISMSDFDPGYVFDFVSGLALDSYSCHVLSVGFGLTLDSDFVFNSFFYS
ncbi:hypothetical protein EVAR_45533_1 [Eumeta japonica]|uniref:Uncharacterized protein n=1 Tax=Eumeta variegata TaxID=151549 RepID=A0A4C1X856_EUMVA|nr:hypothetical protein EVAR_45533_1 [Eumeta japonica]